jgi:hypothetical protein
MVGDDCGHKARIHFVPERSFVADSGFDAADDSVD